MAVVDAFTPRPDGTVVLRSRRQLLAGAGFGVLVLLLGLAGAAGDSSTTVAWVDGVAAVVIGGFLIVAFLRTAVVVREQEVVVRNPLRTHTIPWSEIHGFRIGRYRMLSAVCIVERTDGSTQHASAIQLSGPVRSSGERERQMIDFLNEQAAAHRGS